MSAEVAITVNGDTRTVPAGLTVAQLLQHLGVRSPRVGVERNRALVRRADFESTRVEAGDRYEIVSLVGGG